MEMFCFNTIVFRPIVVCIISKTYFIAAGAVSNGHTAVVPLEIEEVTENPALVINPDRNTLTPLPATANGTLDNGMPKKLPPIQKPSKI